MNTIKGNKLIIKDRSSLHLIEVFMGYTEGYLSEVITWNDIMPVVQKIGNYIVPSKAPYNTSDDLRFEIIVSGYVKLSGFPMPSIFKNVCKEGSLINATWLAVTEFIEWYNKEQSVKESDTSKAT